MARKRAPARAILFSSFSKYPGVSELASRGAAPLAPFQIGNSDRQFGGKLQLFHRQKRGDVEDLHL